MNETTKLSLGAQEPRILEQSYVDESLNTQSSHHFPWWGYAFIIVILLPLGHKSLQLIMASSKKEGVSLNTPTMKSQEVSREEVLALNQHQDEEREKAVARPVEASRPRQTSMRGVQIFGPDGKMRKNKYKIAYRNVEGEIEYLHPDDPRVQEAAASQEKQSTKSPLIAIETGNGIYVQPPVQN